MAMDDTRTPRSSKSSRKKLASGVKEILTELVCFEFPIEWGGSKGDAHNDAGGLCRRLIAIGRMIGAIIQVFGKGVSAPNATKSAISIPVQIPIKDQQLVPHLTIHENFQRTAQELRNNVSKGLLRTHVEALTDLTLVPILRAVADNQVNGDAPPVLVSATGRHAIPVLEDQDFDQPVEEEASTQTGTFPISGIRIASTHDVFILSSGGLAIRADQRSALKLLCWNLQAIYDGAWVDGTIKRGEDRVWELEAGANLVTSTPIAGPEPNNHEQRH